MAFSIVAGAAGQLMLKIGALNQVRNNSILFFERYTLLGLLVYFIAAIAYIYSLRRVPLSLAFPSVSLSYFFVSLAAHLVLGESFTFINVVSLAFISIGIILLAI
ncbi:MAG: EamA family transporter [Cyanobacteriota bacterium]